MTLVARGVVMGMERMVLVAVRVLLAPLWQILPAFMAWSIHLSLFELIFLAFF
jgi:hypothetical protein